MPTRYITYTGGGNSRILRNGVRMTLNGSTFYPAANQDIFYPLSDTSMMIHDNGILVKNNDNNNFTAVTFPFTRAGATVNTGSFWPLMQKNIAVSRQPVGGAVGGIFYMAFSNDSGATYTGIARGTQNVLGGMSEANECLAVGNNYFYLYSVTHGISKHNLTTGEMVSFFRNNATVTYGGPSSNPTGMKANALQVVPGGGTAGADKLYFANFAANKIYISNDNGDSWSEMAKPTSLNDMHFMHVSEDGQTIVLVSINNTKTAKSTNGGSTWAYSSILMSDATTTAAGRANYGIQLTKINGKYFLIYTRYAAGNYIYGMMESSDGLSWSNVSQFYDSSNYTTYSPLAVSEFPATNLAPTDITLSNSSVAENLASGTTIGTLTTADPDSGNTFTYSLGGADAASFSIVGDALKTAAVFNYEVKSSYSITVTATDQGGLTYAKAFTISVVNANEAPTNIALSNSSIAENNAINAVIGTLSTTDPDAGNTFTYSLSGTDAASFNISGSSLRASAVFNYEVKSSYSITVTATDQGGLSFNKAFTISVTDANEVPTNIILSASSIAENNAINAVIGTLSTTDPDSGNTFTYSLSGADASSFNISGSSLRASAVFNYEVKSSYSITVTATDQGGLTYAKAFTISVVNANEAPTDIILSASSIAENNAINAVIGTLSTTDPDSGNTFTYSIPAGLGDDKFNISGNQLRASVAFDYETAASHSVTVRATDQGGEFFSKSFTISVTNDASDDPILLDSSSATEMENGVVFAIISQSPILKEVRFNNQPLPQGSVIRNSATGQKFYKIAGGAKEFYAIPITAPAEWELSAEAEDSWDVLQSY